jgi:hypothetical protein
MHKPVTWPLVRGAEIEKTAGGLSQAELLELEALYCSHGDTVHYTNPPKIFESCEGSFLHDAEGREYLDLQMWYSAVNFGYRNKRLNDAVRRQLDRLPQVASQYLHREKIELAAALAKAAEQRLARKAASTSMSAAARRSRTAPARAQCQGRQEPDARLRGRLSRPHARGLGNQLSYRYRRRYGHFGDRRTSCRSPTTSVGPRG